MYVQSIFVYSIKDTSFDGMLTHSSVLCPCNITSSTSTASDNQSLAVINDGFLQTCTTMQFKEGMIQMSLHITGDNVQEYTLSLYGLSLKCVSSRIEVLVTTTCNHQKTTCGRYQQCHLVEERVTSNQRQVCTYTCKCTYDCNIAPIIRIYHHKWDKNSLENITLCEIEAF